MSFEGYLEVQVRKVWIRNTLVGANAGASGSSLFNCNLGSGTTRRVRGDLVSRVIMGVSKVTIWVIGVTNLLTKSPDPPSKSSSSVDRANHLLHFGNTIFGTIVGHLMWTCKVRKQFMLFCSASRLVSNKIAHVPRSFSAMMSSRSSCPIAAMSRSTASRSTRANFPCLYLSVRDPAWRRRRSKGEDDSHLWVLPMP